MTTEKELTGWEKEFIRSFVTYEEGIEPNPLLRKGLRQDDIISFIKSLITSHTEGIIAKLEGMRDIPSIKYDKGNIPPAEVLAAGIETVRIMSESYNEAIDDAIEIIRSSK